MGNFYDNTLLDNSFNLLEISELVSRISPDKGIIVTDNNNKIIFINDIANRMLGFAGKELLKKKIEAAITKENFEKISENKLGFESFENIITVNGTTMFVKKEKISDTSSNIYNAFIFGSMMDEDTLRDELEKSEHVAKEFEDVLEGSFDGVLVTDNKGNVLLVNKSYERVTGITKDELLGKNMKDLINPIWMKNSVVFPVIEGKSPVSLHHTTKYGKNIIVTGTPLFDSNGDVNKVVVNARDISEIYELRQELQRAREIEKVYFSNESESEYKLEDKGKVIAASDEMKQLFALARRVSAFDTTVLILGESGVGKDVVSKYIHENSHRKSKPFIAINCGAIPEQLLESELFGYEKGAFTGASKDGKMGLFEAAEGGVLFLDEIGEMSSNLQVKLLRVLESRQINRIGSIKPIPVNVRLIAATNKDLESRIQTGEFREDLFYRLNVIQLKIPPLRERKKDIAPLALYFLKNYNQKYGQNKKLTYDVIKEFESYNWPGNIRQLKNIVENMVVISNNEFLQINDLPWYTPEIESKKEDVKEDEDEEIMHLDKAVELAEKKLLTKALAKFKSTRKIAMQIGVDQSTVVRKLKKYGLSQNKNDA